MDINVFLKESCGPDERNQSKVLLTAIITTINQDNQPRPRPLLSRTMDQPVFDVSRRGNFIDVYLEFKSDLDIEFRMLQKIFLKYEEKIREFGSNEKEEKYDEVPLHSLTIAPKKYRGKYYLSCINPITWSLQPKTDGGKNLVLRAVYEPENIILLENSDEDIALGYSEAEREFEQEIAQYNMDKKMIEEANSEQFDYEENMKNKSN